MVCNTRNILYIYLSIYIFTYPIYILWCVFSGCQVKCTIVRTCNELSVFCCSFLFCWKHQTLVLLLLSLCWCRIVLPLSAVLFIIFFFTISLTKNRVGRGRIPFIETLHNVNIFCEMLWWISIYLHWCEIICAMWIFSQMIWYGTLWRTMLCRNILKPCTCVSVLPCCPCSASDRQYFMGRPPNNFNSIFTGNTPNNYTTISLWEIVPILYGM